MLRVLLTNDDGPPAPKSRYIETFYRALRTRGFEVHVSIPKGHRSWASKSLNPWADVAVDIQDIAGDGNAWWLCDGTPAASANIGLCHAKPNAHPFDIVLSGPNFGRNTASGFVLSSGTLAGALEGALAGVKAIAVSFDNENKEVTMGDAGAGESNLVAQACERTIDIVERLLREWPPDVQLFNVNVPLTGTGVAKYSCVDTRARYNSLYTRQGSDALFKFTCNDVKRLAVPLPRIDSKGLPSDAELINDGCISITPLRANFQVVNTDYQRTCSRHTVMVFVLGCGFGMLLTTFLRKR